MDVATPTVKVTDDTDGMETKEMPVSREASLWPLWGIIMGGSLLGLWYFVLGKKRRGEDDK
jgi:hypothetical protein